MADTESTIEHIAVIGMAGRFPGAKNIHEFWDNLVSGKESITFFDKEEMQESGISTAELDNPNYVGAKGYMADGDCFDAAFFGCSPSEAQLMDPQHRILLETAYAALEDAGCNPERYSGYIGVFTSASFNTYLLHHLSRNPSLLSDTNFYQLCRDHRKRYKPLARHRLFQYIMLARASLIMSAMWRWPVVFLSLLP